MHYRAARIADQSNQSLRQDAIQGGDEVVGLDAHVQETANYVHDVVGVDGGENQVARQC